MPSYPVLRRFELTVYKPKSPPSDLSLVPAASLVEFFKPGATVRTGITILHQESQEVDVWYAGTIQDTEDVLVDVTGAQLHVESVTRTSGNMKMLLTNTTVAPSIDLFAGQRLLRLADRPSIYLDPAGKTSAAASQTPTDPDTGRVGCYLLDDRFDCLAPTGSQEGYVYADARGFYVAR